MGLFLEYYLEYYFMVKCLVGDVYVKNIVLMLFILVVGFIGWVLDGMEEMGFWK